MFVNPSRAELTALGETVQLSVQVLDQNAQAMAGVTVTWSTGSPAVATVDASGLVTAVGEGIATIPATAGSVSGSAEITVDQPDRAALVTLYEATGGPSWIDATNWLSDAPLNEWYGVTASADGVVWSVSLGSNNLSGTIPPELHRLC
ncbi:MAG: Ig-like domain-containing protein [Gemmatimonadales bacterium]|nr:Ig-like domain-containing protein [Gemmatimonadales bacterium]